MNKFKLIFFIPLALLLMGSTYRPGETTQINRLEIIDADNSTVNASIDINGDAIFNSVTGFTELDPIYIADPAFSITNAGSGLVITAGERTNIAGVVTIHSDVTNAGSGLIITAGERTAIGTNTTNNTGTVTVHSDISAAGSGIIISAAERTKLAGNANSIQDLRSRFSVALPFKESLHNALSSKSSGTNATNSKPNRKGTRVNNAQGSTFVYWDITATTHDTFLQPLVTSKNAIDWSRELAVYTEFTIGGAGANGRYITWFGIDGNDAATDATALSAMGTADAIGIEVRNLDIFAVAYDGVTFTQTDTTLNAVVGQKIFMTIVSDGAGTVTWFHSTDGVAFATANTEASNMPSGTTAEYDNSFLLGTSATASGADIHNATYSFELFFK